jgi:hypothetical protein
MKKVELQLTKEAIANEGIEVKLTQADVIDMLVGEQVESIRSVYETLRETSLKIEAEITKEYDDFLEAIAAKQIVPKGLQYVKKSSSTTNSNSAQTFDFYILNESIDGRNNIIYSTRKRYILSGCDGKLTLYYGGTISGIEMTGLSEPIPFKFKHSKKLIALLEENQKKVLEFLDLVPAKGMNEREIAKKIKNQFTKEILKSSSADFRKKLKEGFAVDL